MISIAVYDDRKSTVDSMEGLLDKYSVECKEEIRVFKFYTGNSLLENYSGYNGECKVTAENQEFVISIVLPISNKKGIYGGLE